ncbi:MAG: hypothetical protein AUJ74_06970 [Candidatus Omnitrophica bacterium CG1_02_44_16]|nr:MAG: hypothetical protein AUJ74_06970 [Candidatus Omnitrophica bacterium CG1_02_44_16]PIY82234.1 MAG: hypothetical protein COY78_07295 [Candidatus Omnitrophica bacterium CG_4_10_14_0_8_um_filter_44_12]PIZ83634.1 MAG: hypothetical protein COX96_07055 [Candidatus Omnitrophica bacterium CG_4_10_14_0_2_um_filter_44_9]
MLLEEIYRPIKKDLAGIERTIKLNIASGANASVLKITDFLLRAGGKRLRPALVILSAKAALGSNRRTISGQVNKIASAVELIHLASLIHDDVVDHSQIRHNKPTVNSKWGDDVSIILGDYLYSVGFDLISSCRNFDILTCISQATRWMCEGELIQVCERDDFDILKERYFAIIKNKTANLFAASCQAGVLAVGQNSTLQAILKEYGLNLGVAFQIVDDSLDLIGDMSSLGKEPGADFKMGELTLPVLNLISELKNCDKRRELISQKNNVKAFREVRKIFINSHALRKTKEEAGFYVRKAKDALGAVKDSLFKQSLFELADYVVDRMKV